MSLPRLLLVLTLPLYVVDQVTKFWTVFNMEPPNPAIGVDSIHLIEGWVHWVRVHNQGVAFGMGNGTSWAPVVFLLMPLIALAVIRILWVKGFFETKLTKTAVALLLCGIFGNLTDRLIQGFLLEAHKDASFWTRLSEGYVVDFASVKLPLYDKIVASSGGWWPAFNVADSCICIAACLIFISGFFEDPKKKEEAAEDSSKPEEPEKAESKED